jgi:hypothetical protein
MPDKHRELYEKLKEEGFYTKSYDEFVKQFSNPDKLMKLHGLMKQDGLYSKTVDDFKNQFFAPIQETKPDSTSSPKISLKDQRATEQATGVPMSDKVRFNAEVDPQYIKQVVATARKHGNDPYTALAINLAETRFDPEKAQNPFMLGNYNPYGDVIDESMKFMSSKLKYGKDLGKKKEAEILQAWNGYGQLKNMGNMYGIDTNKTPIDMNTNPLYGKRIIDLRENVIKQNPELKGIVDSVLATNPKNDYKLWSEQ